MNRPLAILVLMLALASCLSTFVHAQAAGNAMCPVMTDEAADPEISTLHDGRRVFFCCLRCRKQFISAPERYLGNLASLKADSHEAQGGGRRIGSPVTGSAPPRGGEAPDAGPAHEHGMRHDGPERVPRLVRFLGKFHPLAVHFPIALLVTAAFAESLFLVLRRRRLAEFGRLAVAIGGVGAVAATLLGWAAGASARFPGELSSVLEFHRWAGTATGFAIIATAALSEYARRRGGRRAMSAYRAGLLTCTFLIGVTGHLGGSLVYGLDYYSW